MRRRDGKGRRAAVTWAGRALAVAVAWLIPLVLLTRTGADGGGLQVSPAAGFVDSVGVQTHGDFLDTAYADAARVRGAIADLGIRHVRDGVTPDPRNERHLRFLEGLGRSGVRLTLTIDEPRGAGAPIEERLAVVRERLLPYTEALEGPNEGDTSQPAGWPERVRDYQRELHAAIQADPALRGLPVLAPSLGLNVNQPALGDLDGIADEANLHSYPGGLPPSRAELAAEIEAARGAVGGAPLVVTETGYHNAWAEPRRQPFTSERAAGIYYPRLFLEHFATGVRRTFAYELVDEKPEPAGADQEQHFGLLRNDFTPKPAAESVRRLLALVRGPGGGDGRRAEDDEEAGDLDFELDARTPLRRLALRREDGRLLVFLWQTASVWDRDARRDLRPPPVRAAVRLGATFGDVELHGIGPRARAPRDLGARRALAVDVPADTVVALVLGPPPGAFPLPLVQPPRRPPRPPATEPAMPAARRADDAEDDPSRL